MSKTDINAGNTVLATAGFYWINIMNKLLALSSSNSIYPTISVITTSSAIQPVLIVVSN